MIDKFLKDGWVTAQVGCAHSIRYSLERKTGCGLGAIHRYNDDEAIKNLHISLSEYFWKMEYSLEIAKSILPTIQALIGPDVMVQYMPYLRIARPGKPQDNIGYHKDTQYGQNPYELAVHIPFVDLDEKSAIRVISGSHVMPESAFTAVTPEGPRIEKGSIENRIGRPYAPKPLAVPEGLKATPLRLNVGQMAIFSPAIFHGQEVNEGNITRVSCDLRFISVRAPVEIRKGKVHAGYIEVSKSPIEQVATKYYEVQGGN